MILSFYTRQKAEIGLIRERKLEVVSIEKIFADFNQVKDRRTLKMIITHQLNMLQCIQHNILLIVGRLRFF